MKIDFITKEDLYNFKAELIEEIKGVLKANSSDQKLWLRSAEVRDLLKISNGTLQNLRVNGSLSYTRLGGTLYYSYEDIAKMLEDKG